MKRSIIALLLIFSVLRASEAPKPTKLGRKQLVELTQNAIWKNDYATIERLFKEGTLPINTQDEQGNTLLHLALQQESHDILPLLIAAGSDINKKNSKGMTPLMEAVRTGDQKTVQELIGLGADLDVQDKDGETALIWAMAHKHDAIVELLIAAGADIHKKDKHQYNLLGYACDIHKAKETVARGLSKRTRREELWEFIEHNNSDGVRKLLPTLDASLINLKNKDRTVLLWAVHKNYRDIVAKLLQAGADVNLQDELGLSPLMVAIQNEKCEPMVEMLLKAGADINAQNILRRTALANAIEFNHTACAMLLIKQGANINVADIAGNTPLLLAIDQKNIPLVAQLLEMGADVNVRNNVGTTPLMRAAGINAPQTAKFLVFWGADIKTRDNYGNTALDYAISPERRASIKTALEQGLAERAKKDTKKAQLIKKSAVSTTLAPIAEGKLEECKK